MDNMSTHIRCWLDSILLGRTGAQWVWYTPLGCQIHCSELGRFITSLKAILQRHVFCILLCTSSYDLQSCVWTWRATLSAGFWSHASAYWDPCLKDPVWQRHLPNYKGKERYDSRFASDRACMQNVPSPNLFKRLQQYSTPHFMTDKLSAMWIAVLCLIAVSCKRGW